MPPRQNSKAVAAKERKEAHKAAKNAELQREQEIKIAEEWKKGSNLRKQAKDDAAANKADEAARKRREKQELLAAEEAASGGGGGGSKVKKNMMMNKKKGKSGSSNKKKKKDELSLLEDALVDNAEKKSRQIKRTERLKKEREEKALLKKNSKKNTGVQTTNDVVVDPMMANTNAMIGNVAEYTDASIRAESGAAGAGGGESLVGRKANIALSATDGCGSGLDSALLSALNVTTTTTSLDDAAHPEKRMKALHKAFEERLLPQMKEEYPGLRLTQYKEKIFAIWKKSPENPKNWPTTSSSYYSSSSSSKQQKQ